MTILLFPSGVRYSKEKCQWNTKQHKCVLETKLPKFPKNMLHIANCEHRIFVAHKIRKTKVLNKR